MREEEKSGEEKNRIEKNETGKEETEKKETEKNEIEKNEIEKKETEHKAQAQKVPKYKMHLLGGVIIVLLVILDQFTKYLAVRYLKGKPPVVVLKGVLELQYLENTGSAFSMFRGQRLLILLVGAIVLATAVFFLYKLPADKKFCITHILISIMIAGAVGNMIDRIRFGYVVDFVSLILIHFPIFNAADCYVVVSTVILFVLFMFVYKESDLKWIKFVMK